MIMKIGKLTSCIAAGSALLSFAGISAVHADTAMGAMDMSRYGGPVYTGAPALAVTASLVKAGGGADNFSIATALTSMVGPKLVTAEVNKLTTQYGSDKVAQWITTFNFAVGDALKIATADGVTLPAPTLSGKQLAVTLVKAGLDKNGTFYTEYLLDKAVTHGIHNQVMNDIDAKYGGDVDTDYHAISNQAMVDLAHALGYPSVQVASLH
jgi:hypothetical protein